MLFGRFTGNRNRAQHFIGDGDYGLHFRHIVDAHHVGAGEDGGRYACGGSELRFEFRGSRGSQEGFARGTDEDRVFQPGEVGKTGQDLGVLFLALAEAQAGVENDGEAVDAGAAGAADRGVEILGDGKHHVGDGTQFAPGFGGAAHVVEDKAGIVLYDGLGKERVPGEATGIVDDFGAVFHGEFGDFGLVGIDRDGDAKFAFEAL
jgi:hypothetical protein